MKNGRLLCLMILIPAGGLFWRPADAQDTAKKNAAPRNDAFSFEPVRKRDTPPKTEAAVSRKDTAIKKKDTVVKTSAPVKPDTGEKKPAKTPRQRPDSLQKGTANNSSRRSPVHASAVVHPGDSGRRVSRPAAVVHHTEPEAPILSLPSFTRDSIGGYRPFVRFLMTHNAVFQASDSAAQDITALRNDKHAEETGLFSGIFYIITGVLFLLGILRLAFSKYFNDLFRAFFNPTLSQRQLRDQLSQTPFPSLMLNLFFAVSAGLYLFLVLLHYRYFVLDRPLWLIPVFTGLVMIIYVFKYLFLHFAGWLFGYQDTAAGYAFTLYMVNKVLGIALLPFSLILAFSPATIADAALNVSLMLIVLLFIYRYIRIYGMARNQIFFRKFHFFIYLCAFEIAPILIVGKLVLIWLNGA